jgi:hypothetical protein
MPEVRFNPNLIRSWFGSRKERKLKIRKSKFETNVGVE